MGKVTLEIPGLEYPITITSEESYVDDVSTESDDTPNVDKMSPDAVKNYYLKIRNEKYELSDHLIDDSNNTIKSKIDIDISDNKDTGNNKDKSSHKTLIDKKKFDDIYDKAVKKEKD